MPGHNNQSARRRATAPDPAFLFNSNYHSNYYTPPVALNDRRKDVRTHHIYATPTFANVYGTEPTNGYWSDYSSDYSQMEPAESESLSNYEINLERHKGLLFSYCVEPPSSPRRWRRLFKWTARKKQAEQTRFKFCVRSARPFDVTALVLKCSHVLKRMKEVTCFYRRKGSIFGRCSYLTPHRFKLLFSS